MTPSEPLAVILKDFPSLYSSSGSSVHSVALLALGGLGYIRQAELLLFQRCQVRSEDYAARVARPRVEVLRGIVLLKERISGIAEYAFDKVEIAHERARSKEAYLHRFFGLAVGYFGANRRAQYIETQVFALRSCVEVNRSSSISSGAENARAHKFLKTRLGTDFLSAGTGSPPSATWKTPAVVRLSVARII